jgi:predicted membrane-bound spermidine synthase
MVTPIYFTHGKLLAESGNMRIYLFNDMLHLEEGPGHTLWAIESEIHEYREQMADYPNGEGLEIGLGLGVASRYILTCEGVKSLTTVEISEDVIKVQKQVNPIDDPRHTIICMDGWEYIISTDKKYNFIFMDMYHFIDEDGLPLIEKYVEMCKKRVLKEGGKIVGWFDVSTPEEFIKPFYDLFE